MLAAASIHPGSAVALLVLFLGCHCMCIFRLVQGMPERRVLDHLHRYLHDRRGSHRHAGGMGLIAIEMGHRGAPFEPDRKGARIAPILHQFYD